MPLWEQLEAHIPGVYRFLLRLSGDLHQAEDLAQETLLKAWKNRGQLRDEGSLRVWLFRIAVNLWRDQVRQNKRRPVVESSTEAALDKHPPPDDKLAQREEVLEVLKAVERLPPRQREVLHLSAVEGLAVSEIAEVLGISTNAVKVHLSEARKRMREAFPLNPPSNTGIKTSNEL